MRKRIQITWCQSTRKWYVDVCYANHSVYHFHFYFFFPILFVAFLKFLHSCCLARFFCSLLYTITFSNLEKTSNTIFLDRAWQGARKHLSVKLATLVNNLFRKITMLSHSINPNFCFVRTYCLLRGHSLTGQNEAHSCFNCFKRFSVDYFR